jgi:hypothetical protein
MKMRLVLGTGMIALLTMGGSAWAQWSPDPAKNLDLAGRINNDQVQPKLIPLKNDEWYISYFDANPNDPPPQGYDVYYQRLDVHGYKMFRNWGSRVALLSNSSTEDYGLDIDINGDALLAFLDTREGANQQVTAARMDKSGAPLWGTTGVQLTNDQNFNAAPKIAGTSDGKSVVAWTSNSNVVVQKLDEYGKPAWSAPLTFLESGYNYSVADLHASDNGSVIISLVRDQGFGSARQLRTNKISASGELLWGASNVVLFDQGSLQFGNFPYFITDGAGGAVFAWYTAYPVTQVFTQHIRADGSAAFRLNGAAGSTNTSNIRYEPTVAYRQATDETFLFWTEADSNQFFNGVSGQKFDGKGNSQWAATGLVIVPLGSNTQTFVKAVSAGSGALVFWVDSPGYGADTIQAIKLNGLGRKFCSQFAVSTAPATKYGLAVATASSARTAVVWADDRIGNNAIYIQNVNPDCTLGN